MKKIMISIIPLIILFAGCAGKATPAENIPELPPNLTFDDIDRIVENIESSPAFEIPEQPIIEEVQPQTQQQTEALFPRAGMWRVSGRGRQGSWTANMVISELNNDLFEGHFAWRGGLDGRSGGTEYFRGVYDPQTRKVSLQGYRLANARGIGIDKYEAFLASDSKDFVSGSWSDGGRWEAIWEEDDQQ